MILQYDQKKFLVPQMSHKMFFNLLFILKKSLASHTDTVIYPKMFPNDTKTVLTTLQMHQYILPSCGNFEWQLGNYGSEVTPLGPKYAEKTVKAVFSLCI